MEVFGNVLLTQYILDQIVKPVEIKN